MQLHDADGIRAVSAGQAGEGWNSVIREASWVPCDYLHTNALYHAAYLPEQFESAYILDSVLFDGEQPIAVWPLNLRKSEGRWLIGSNGDYVHPPLAIANLSKRQRKTLIRYSLAQINRLCELRGIQRWRGAEALLSASTSEWHRSVMELGANLTARHELCVNLSDSIPTIRSHFRKSYRPLISQAQKMWRVEVIANGRKEPFEEFRLLHKRVAGRETRSRDTWELQREATDKGCAFLVLISDREQPVGGALFQTSPHEALYSVAAYDRSHFDKPLGHLVQSVAIEHMKSIGLRWYRLGHRPYPGEDPTPNEKQLNIGFFKEGFASETRLVLLTDCKVV